MEFQRESKNIFWAILMTSKDIQFSTDGPYGERARFKLPDLPFAAYICRLCWYYYRFFKIFVEETCLWQLEALFNLMPYKMELPRHPSGRRQVVQELCETCEKRALALFKALTWLLPAPLVALYVTATADGTLILVMLARFLVDGDMPWFKWFGAPDGKVRSTRTRSVSIDKLPSSTTRRSRVSANGLVLFGIFIHVFQFFHFYNRTILISSPYGFCSNIFVFLVTGFTSYSFWATVLLCVTKNFCISLLYLTLQPSLTDTEIEYFHAYWCSCAIILTVVTPVNLETIARITAEGQAKTYKKHMNDLLRASFDACVWVDDKLRVMEAEPKLDLMFMRSMKKRSLLEFVKQPECTRFAQNVTNSIENHSTSLHHVTFATSDLNHLDVDLYITSKLSYWLRDGQHHLVGIRIRSCPSSPQEIHKAPPSTAATSEEESAASLAEEDMSRSPPERPKQWECPECHCVNFLTASADSLCILCGFKNSGDFTCGTIFEEYQDEESFGLVYPHSEISSSWEPFSRRRSH